MNKKLQVFVSSTYKDLKEERQAAVQAILDAGHIPAGMELFKGGKSQLKTIYKWIDESDVYMLILGGRYGDIEEESGLSYTELEYRYALSKNMPVFAIVLRDGFLYKKASEKGKDAIFEKDNVDKYDEFKKFVKSKVVRFSQNIDQISSIIHSHLNDIYTNSDNNLVGWIRANANIYSYEHFSHKQLCDLQRKIIDEILSKMYPQNCLKDFSDTLSLKLNDILKSPYGILDLSERLITLDFANKRANTLKVTVTKTLDYIYIEPDAHSFHLNFRATKQQAETYKAISLDINGENYTSKLKITIKENTNRGQLLYNVTSNPIMLSHSKSKVVYVSSYECPINEFFQSHRLNCLCKQFKANITLSDDVRKNIF